MKDPQPIEIEAEEVERLIEQAQQGRLDAAAQKRIVPLLRTLLWLERTLLETRVSLAKLRKVLFGKRTEKPTQKPSQPSDGSAGSGGDSGSKTAPPSDGKLPGVEVGDARERGGTPPLMKTDPLMLTETDPQHAHAGVGNVEGRT